MYKTEPSDRLIPYSVARDQFRCGCPAFTPIGLSFCQTDMTKLSEADYREFEQHPFRLRARCTRCRKQNHVYLTIDELPYIPDDEVKAIRTIMDIGYCTHPMKDYIISENILGEGSCINRIVYCVKCRKTYKVIV